jgi:hypothetical protein
MNDTSVYQTGGSELEVNMNGRKVRVLYNPETEYALLPAGVYGSEPDLVAALKESELIEGVFNHETISEVN